ncbi:MAG: hypothetical protein ACR2MM_07250 [Flavobacteriaceae bacterium]
MMNKLLIFLACITLFACKESKKTQTSEDRVELSVLEKVAKAHGYDHWKNVRELSFTFNVDRDTAHFERSWKWKPVENVVTGIQFADTTTYMRKELDSTLMEVDASFINDKYWLLAPFNLVWDQKNFTFELIENTPAPISKKPMQKLTIVYGNEGGYTPGDAYDFFFEDDYIIREWIFRKENQEDPGLVTSWEDYESIEGLLISKMHKREDGTWSLSFTDIEVR